MMMVLKEPRKIVPLFIAALFFLTLYLNSFPYTAKVIFYPFYKELRKLDFIDNKMDFYINESSNFKIFYKPISSSCVEMVKDNAEQSLKKVTWDFNYEPESKIDIIIYPEYSEMSNKIGLGRGSTAMGVYYGGSISLLEPTQWIGSEKNMEEIFIKQGPIVHELTHYLLDDLSNGNIPVWFTEGVALYEEYRVNDVEWAQSRNYATYYSVDELEKCFYELDEIKAYRQSYLIVKYIGSNFGMQTIGSIVSELKLGKSLNQALVKTIKIDEYELFKCSLPV